MILRPLRPADVAAGHVGDVVSGRGKVPRLMGDDPSQLFTVTGDGGRVGARGVNASQEMVS